MMKNNVQLEGEASSNHSNCDKIVEDTIKIDSFNDEIVFDENMCNRIISCLNQKNQKDSTESQREQLIPREYVSSLSFPFYDHGDYEPSKLEFIMSDFIPAVSINHEVINTANAGIDKKSDVCKQKERDGNEYDRKCHLPYEIIEKKQHSNNRSYSSRQSAKVFDQRKIQERRGERNRNVMDKRQETLSRLKLTKCLHAEQRAFMKHLKATRENNDKIEKAAAITIQRYMRGLAVRRPTENSKDVTKEWYSLDEISRFVREHTKVEENEPISKLLSNLKMICPSN